MNLKIKKLEINHPELGSLRMRPIVMGDWDFLCSFSEKSPGDKKKFLFQFLANQSEEPQLTTSQLASLPLDQVVSLGRDYLHKEGSLLPFYKDTNDFPSDFANAVTAFIRKVEKDLKNTLKPIRRSLEGFTKSLESVSSQEIGDVSPFRELASSFKRLF